MVLWVCVYVCVWFALVMLAKEVVSFEPFSGSPFTRPAAIGNWCNWNMGCAPYHLQWQATGVKTKSGRCGSFCGKYKPTLVTSLSMLRGCTPLNHYFVSSRTCNCNLLWTGHHSFSRRVSPIRIDHARKSQWTKSDLLVHDRWRSRIRSTGPICRV